MRITDANRLNKVERKKKKPDGNPGGESFSLPNDNSAPAKTGASASTSDVGSIDALLALQSVEDPTFAKKKTIRRGHDLLDGLEQVKTDLLVGQISESRLDNMLNLVTKARNKADPELDAIIDDIELRVRVELAKLNKF
ncbi:flagellar assembly protein FliX [Maritalea sp.]|uniref:flagellar assembly protein FliX n=1 Tax=Maritalea sp. TaxID=2003361 RepID=UPI003EF51859